MTEYLVIERQRYERTGLTMCGKRVFAKVEEWERAVRSLTNELLYVETEPGVLVPHDQFVSTPSPEGENR